VNSLLAQTSLATYSLVGLNIVILAMLIFTVTILVKALQKPYFFSFSETENPADEISSSTLTSVTNSERIEKEKKAQDLLNYMRNKKAYLEPELTLEQLASQLALKPRVLSQTINEILGQNFYDFINRYRIEEAARLLTNPKDKKITILEVLYEVGFNSKSSFNNFIQKIYRIDSYRVQEKTVRLKQSDFTITKPEPIKSV